jgi:hypothetical protein
MSATPVMNQDKVVAFDLPAVACKKWDLTAGRCRRTRECCCCGAWNGGWDWPGGWRNAWRTGATPLRITHPLEEMLRLRMFAIAAGYEDADDCDALRHDPVFKMAVRHAPESGDPLCSRPTMSRLENAPGKIELAQMQGALVLGSSGVIARPVFQFAQAKTLLSAW